MFSTSILSFLLSNVLGPILLFFFLLLLFNIINIINNIVSNATIPIPIYRNKLLLLSFIILILYVVTNLSSPVTFIFIIEPFSRLLLFNISNVSLSVSTTGSICSLSISFAIVIV